MERPAERKKRRKSKSRKDARTSISGGKKDRGVASMFISIPFAMRHKKKQTKTAAINKWQLQNASNKSMMISVSICSSCLRQHQIKKNVPTTKCIYSFSKFIQLLLLIHSASSSTYARFDENTEMRQLLPRRGFDDCPNQNNNDWSNWAVSN